MQKYIKNIITIFIVMLILGGTVYGGLIIKKSVENKEKGIGNVIDEYKGVNVYYNGDSYYESYGKSYSSDGYYYGYKWQCVEFVKRFYKDALNHEMPNVYGNAKDFYDDTIGQGELNEDRDLIQFKNGENEKPKEDDLLVFTDTTYGHVAIVTEVGEDYIEVVQQNMGTTSREKYDLKYEDGKYYVTGKRDATCWLRIK